MDNNTSSVLPSIVTSLIRQALLGIGGSLVASGKITDTQEEQIIGVVLLAVGSIWAFYQKYKANQRLKAAIAAPAGKAE